MAVFWNDLNSYLVSAFDTAMGGASAYSTMKAQTINDRIFADAHEWALWTLPAISVACYQVGYNATEHMGTTNKLYTKQYRCMAFGIISGLVNITTTPVVDTVSDNIREYYERMESVLRTNTIAVASAGVIARSITISSGDLDVTRYPSDDIDSNRRMGIAYFQFTVTAKV